MEAIDELSQLSDSMKQAGSLLTDEDPDETSSSRRPATFLNVVALGNVVMPSWFDVPELPFKAGSPINESSVLEAVKIVHAIIDQEIAEGTNL